MREYFCWDLFKYFFPRVISALPQTLLITLVSTFLGTIVGGVFAILKIKNIPILSSINSIVLSFLRGTSLYIQLYIVYFGVPFLFKGIDNINLDISTYSAVFIAYGLNMGAFIAETMRSAYQTVPKSQFDACRSMGFTSYQSMKYIILPQAIRIGLPSYTNDIVNIFQDTSLAFSIGIIEMIGKVQVLGSVIYKSFEGYISAAIIFMLFSILINYISGKVSKEFTY